MPLYFLFAILATVMGILFSSGKAYAIDQMVVTAEQCDENDLDCLEQNYRVGITQYCDNGVYANAENCSWARDGLATTLAMQRGSKPLSDPK